MKVWLVGAGPGDPGLLTLLGREALAQADVIVYDALANPSFLDFARPCAEKIYVGKMAGNHALPQAQINELLASRAREGKTVVRLKGGDPYIFGRGGEEAEYLCGQGIPFQEVPGITSAIAAPAYAGIPLTDRRAASSLCIITGHESDMNKGIHNWDAFVRSGATLVFVMGMRNLEVICYKLLQAGMDEQMPAAVVYRGCTPKQKTVVAPLKVLPRKVAEAGLANPAVIVVGKAVALRDKLDWLENLPLFGKRIVVTRARAQASSMTLELRRLGADVLECPVIKIRPLDDYTKIDRAIDQLEKYAWVIFTSVNGVEYFFERLNACSKDSRVLAPCNVAAIGPGTADALLDHGIRADLVPPEFVAESVAESLKARDNLNGRHILLARALEARDALPHALEAQGAMVTIAPLYQTVPENGCTDVNFAKVDCISFASSSAVRNFLKIKDKDQFIGKSGPIIAAIGPITAHTLEEAGLPVEIMPTEYTIPALVAAIAAYFAKTKSGIER